MTHEFTAPHNLSLPGVANLSEYFGLWAVAVDPFQALVERWNGVDLRTHIANPASQAAAAGQANKELNVTPDGIALIQVRGTLMKSVSSMSGGTSLTYLRRQVSLAAGDEAVKGIMLVHDTPGGTTAGTADLSDAINAAKAKKPVVSFVEDMCCSGGVWLASQADRIYANQGSAIYGSIGVYSVLIDASKRAEQLGVKVHVIRTGPNKGAGHPGDAVTPEQIAMMQAYVDSVHSQFVSAVAAGRKQSVDTIQQYADGGIFTAAQAADRGLIDGVKTFEAAYAELVGMARARTKPATNAGAKRMSETQIDNTPKAATIAELKAACPGAPSDWVLGQLEAGATLAAAQTAFITLQAKQLDEAKANAAKQLEDAKAKGGGGLGVAIPVRRAGASVEASAAEESGDPVADFHAACAAKLKSGMSRLAAVQAVSRENPQLHKNFLLATNEERSKGLIDDRFRPKAGAR